MKFYTKNLINSFLFVAVAVTLGLSLSACSSKKPFDGGSQSEDPSTSPLKIYSGKVVVTTVSTDPATGPGLVTMFNQDGSLHSSLRDLFPNLEWASGSVFQSPDKVLVLIANSSRVEKLDLTNLTNNNFTTARINGSPNRGLAQDAVDGTVYVAEQTANTIEKYDSNGVPIGAPFINTTTGACVLANPSGIAVQSNRRLLAVQSTRLLIYDQNGGCLAAVTAAPFNANTPYAVAYHPQTDKILVGFYTNSAIMACNTSGASCTTIYSTPTIISNPRSMTVDSGGAIYVGSSGTDTIEKLLWTGSGLATRATTSPFIGPGIYTQNPTSVMVIP